MRTPSKQILKKSKLPVYKIVIAIAIAIAVSYISYILIFPKVAIKWHEGDRLSYTYKTKSVLDTFEMRGGGRTRINSYLEGILRLRIYKVDKAHDTVQTAFKFEPQKLKITGIDSDKIKNMYNATFLVEFSLSGEPKNFRFSKTVAAEDERFLKDMLNSLQFVTTDNARRSWETNETIPSGLLLSEYTSTGSSSFQKKRIRHIKKSYAIAPPVINKSHFEITLGKSSWVSSVKGYEKTTLGSESEMRITTYFQNELTPIEGGICDFFDNTQSFDDLAKNFTSETTPKNEISAWDAVRNNIYAEQLKNASVQSLLADLRAKKMPPSTVVELLSHLFAIKKESLSNAASIIRSGILPPSEYQLILLAMSKFGSTESQQFLINFIENKGLPNRLRADAAVYTRYLNNVSINTVKNLEELAKTTRSEKQGTLSNTIILALGSMCVDNKNEGQSSEEIHRFINDKLSSGISDRNELSAFILAAGNTHNPAHVKSISEYTGDKIPSIRAQAVEALQYMEGEEADNAILSLVKRESDTDVMTSALQTQLSRKQNPAVTDAIVSRLSNDANESARLPMVEYLAAQDNVSSSTKSILKNILKDETNPRTRAKINIILNKEAKK